MADVDNSVGVIYQRRNTRSGSDSDKVSPGVKDAMDRIFPKSPSKFLQNPFPDNHDIRLLGGKKLPSSTATVSVSSVLDVNQSLACTVSNAHITTDTTTTATAIFTGLSTSASGTKSPIMSSVPTDSNDMPSLPATSIVKNNISVQNGDASTLPKTVSNSRVSRADLQMCIQTIEESPRLSVSEKLCSDSDASSQSEVSKVKIKKRKKKWKIDSPQENNSLVSLLADCAGNGSSHSEINSLTNGEINFSLDNAIMTHSPIKVQQRLPKVLRYFINVDRHAKYIQRKFLPCYIVLKKVSEDDMEKNYDLSLLERVKHLSDLCAKNHIDCVKFKSLHYRNIFEECLIQNSEDEFVNPRGRSLRKRNQNVSYVEPSEDDLLEEFNSQSKKKRAQNKTADEGHQKIEDHKKDDKKSVASIEKVRNSELEHKSDTKNNMTRVEQNDDKHMIHNLPEANSSKTGTAQTGMRDDKGRSLVYVYPKGSLQKSGSNKEGKPSPKKRIGPASKTNQPLNIHPTSLSTLSLPKSLLGGNVLGHGMTSVTSQQIVPPLVQPQLSTASTTSSPQFYMVKIDGKDFLVPVMGGSTTPRPVTPGLPNAQSIINRAPTPNMAAQPFSVPRLSPVMIPGMSLPGVRMLSTALSTPNIPNILSSVPLIGTPQAATSCIPVCGLSSIGLGGNRPQHLVPSSIVANAVSRAPKSVALTSLVTTPIATSMNLPSSIPQSVLTTKNYTPGTSSLVAPFAAPASTTVLRNTRPRVVMTSSAPIVTSGASATGTRCFRIIMPGCSASGMPARIATLGSQANSSPLTHMALSSSLLPQRKRSVESDISPEKRAAKRRRLEKKYPLPPGVVIKTEPDEVPQHTTTTVQSGSVRSLLGQNIQLITSGARGSPGSLQNIRLVAPLSGSRQMRLGSNFIIRAPNNSTVNLSSGSFSTSAACASSLIVSPSTQSSLMSLQNSSSAATTVNSVSVSTTAISSPTTVAVTKSTALTAKSFHSTLSTSAAHASDKITTLSYSVSSSNSITSPFSSSKEQGIATSLNFLKGGIEGLRKLISAQENAGLKGPRLDKLRELLAQKEKLLTEREKEQADSQISPQLSGVTASDPFVID